MLEVKDITLTKGEQKILEHLSLTANPNEVHSIHEMNGTGKSALVYAIMGLSGHRPQSGKILFAGKDITNLSVIKRARRSMTPA